VESHKRPLDMVEIARALPEMDFVMVGAPVDKRIVDRLVTENPPNLHYLGSVSDHLKKDLIRKCSVGVTTSVYEGFGWTPFEFLSKCRPVLARPLPVFKEIYGGALIYASNAAEFVEQLRALSKSGFQANIPRESIERFRSTYNFSKAALRASRVFGRSFTILGRDLPTDSEFVLGSYLVNWRLWKAFVDNGAHVAILSNGSKFSRQFGLLDRTTLVGRVLLPFRKKLHALEERDEPLDRARKILNLAVLSLEPLCFVQSYVKNRKAMPSPFIVASDESGLFAAIVLKRMLGKKIGFLVHDARFHSLIWTAGSLPVRVYYLLFSYCLGHADCVVVVSKATRAELCLFYPHPERVILLW